MGINTGRLGFLSHVSVSEVDEALEQFVNSEYTIDPRSFIQIKSEEFDFGDFPYALNEITINNATRNEMIKINGNKIPKIIIQVMMKILPAYKIYKIDYY